MWSNSPGLEIKMGNPSVLVLEDAGYRKKCFRSRMPFSEIVDTVPECLEQLDGKHWDLLFLDHDLNQETYVDPAGDDCGSEVVRWLVTHRGLADVDRIIVHTLNDDVQHQMVSDLAAAQYFVTMIPHCDIDEAVMERLLAPWREL